MRNYTDPNYLKNLQYGNAGNLEARIRLHKQFSTNPQGYITGFLIMPSPISLRKPAS